MRNSKVDVDLNLIEVIILMCDLGSLKAVASRLGKSESSVSKALAKASSQLGHVLFVRGSTGLEPTHYTRSIYPNIKQALAQMRLALNLEAFDPSTYDKPIHIAMLAQPMSKFAVNLLSRLAELFPNTSIELSTWQSNTQQRILDNEIDFGLHALTEQLDASIYQKVLLNDALVLAVSEKYQGLGWDEIQYWPCVLTRTSGWNDNRFKVTEKLQARGITHRSTLIVDDVDVAIGLAKQGKYLLPTSRLSIPRALIEMQTSPGFEIPIKLVGCMKINDRDAPLQNCLVEVFKQTFKSVQGEA